MRYFVFNVATGVVEFECSTLLNARLLVAEREAQWFVAAVPSELGCTLYNYRAYGGAMFLLKFIVERC